MPISSRMVSEARASVSQARASDTCLEIINGGQNIQRASGHGKGCAASHQVSAWGGIPSGDSVFHPRALRAEAYYNVTLDEAHEMNGVAWPVL
jgi:hypothetical protein